MMREPEQETTGKIYVKKETGELVRVLCEADDEHFSVVHMNPIAKFIGVFTIPKSELSEIYEQEPTYDYFKKLVGQVVEGWDFAKCGMVTGARINKRGEEQLKISGLGWVGIDVLRLCRLTKTNGRLIKTVYKSFNGYERELTEEQYALL